MKFGVFLPSFIQREPPHRHARRIREFARRAEELGFDSLWITDHIVTARRLYSVSWLDSLITLSHVAALTERVALGTSILILPVLVPAVVAPDPEDETRRVLAVTKNNLAAPVSALAFRLVPDPERGCARIEWDGETTHTAAQLLETVDQEERSAGDDAAEFLREVLAAGPLPAADEHQHIRAWITEHGVADDGLGFVAGTSDRILPSMAAEPIDVAFIDGKHSFPHPIVDWHYLSTALQVGGVLLVDDLPIPAVAPVARHMLLDPCWEMLEIADNRAGVFRKLAEPEPHDDWEAQPYNRGYPDFGFLPPAERLPLQARHAVRQGRPELGERVPALRRTWRRLTGPSDR